MARLLHRRQACGALFAGGMALGGLFVPPQVRAQPSSSPRMGINLAGPADWNTELPLVDVFRFSRPWISQQQGRPWGKGPPLQLDQHGWVKRLAPGCWAETLLCTIQGGHYPSGRYTVFYRGRGRLEFGGAARTVAQQPGKITLQVDSRRGAIFLRIRETDPHDYIRDIHVIMPGFERSWRRDPFHPEFLRRWRGMACLRFMDWMETNNSPIRSWDQRPRLQDATLTGRGVPLELMLQLCNRLEADPWFCMPHQADDQYVRNFAQQVRSHLAPQRKVYIEYSNEVWNGIFQQSRYAQQQARRLGLGPADRPWEGGGMYYARRSVEIFRIWQQVFGDTRRLVRVLCWQAGNAWWLDNIILSHQGAHRHADAVGIAPYLGMNVRGQAQGDALHADAVAGWSVERVLDYVEQEALPRAVQAMTASKRMADKYRLRLVAYEGGQHLVGVAGGENNQRLTRLFHQANAHERMGRIYDQYFAAWERIGGGLFCYYSSVVAWNKWGSWGALQYADEDPRRSPKMMALLRWARRWGQAVALPRQP